MSCAGKITGRAGLYLVRGIQSPKAGPACRYGRYGHPHGRHGRCDVCLGNAGMARALPERHCSNGHPQPDANKELQVLQAQQAVGIPAALQSLLQAPRVHHMQEYYGGVEVPQLQHSNLTLRLYFLAQNPC